VIFSSRVIPGNEKSIGRIQNLLAQRGVRSSPTATPRSMSPAIPRATSWCGSISGCARRSPCRCTGEYRHLVEHAAWRALPGADVDRRAQWQHGAAGAGPARSSTTCSPAAWRATARASWRWTGEGLRERRKMLWNGAAVATVVLDGRGTARDAGDLDRAWLDDAPDVDEAHDAALDAIKTAVHDSVAR
jgi:ribonuclease J